MKLRGHHKRDESSLNQGTAYCLYFVWDEPRGKLFRKALDRFRVQAQQLKIEPQIPVMARLKLKVPPA